MDAMYLSIYALIVTLRPLHTPYVPGWNLQAPYLSVGSTKVVPEQDSRGTVERARVEG